MAHIFRDEFSRLNQENFHCALQRKENLFVVIDNHDKILEYKAPQKIIEKSVPNKYKKQYQEINIDNKKYNKKYQNKTMFIDEIGLFRLSIKSK